MNRFETEMRPRSGASFWLFLPSAGLCQGQSMFRGDPVHSGCLSTAAAPAPVSSGEMEIPDRRPNCFLTGDGRNKKIYFGGDDGNIYAVDSGTGPPNLETDHQRARFLPLRRSRERLLYATSYDGKLYGLNAETGGGEMEICHRRRTPLRSERSPWNAAGKPDHRRSIRRIFVQPGGGGWIRLLWERRREPLLG